MHDLPRCLHIYVDAKVFDQADRTLNALGLTVEGAIKLILARLAYEGAPPPREAANDHDARLREHVRIALVQITTCPAQASTHPNADADGGEETGEA